MNREVKIVRNTGIGVLWSPGIRIGRPVYRSIRTWEGVTISFPLKISAGTREYA
jgi:hypothetical protein